MKQKLANQKASQRSSRKADQAPSAGAHGIAIAPPTYGIDAIDHGLADSPANRTEVVQRQADVAGLEEDAERSLINKTGLPDRLKEGIENLSGLSLEDVRVHYNSSRPAQVQALAYTQGSEIHVAPGQERHLPHEAWHVVQQAQGRVQPTLQMKAGVALNDSQPLEQEADVMGARALQPVRPQPLQQVSNDSQTIQRTPATAAQALFAGGNKVVKKSILKGKFAKDHTITAGDQAAIQLALDALWQAVPQATAVVQQDVTIPAQRPTAGGMAEGDATALAAQNGWTQSPKSWKCSDTAHSPKGKVYESADGNYYGADNTGHVGWGFKVWTKKNATTLAYKGNMVWDGAAWRHIARGT